MKTFYKGTKDMINSARMIDRKIKFHFSNFFKYLKKIILFISKTIFGQGKILQ